MMRRRSSPGTEGVSQCLAGLGLAVLSSLVFGGPGSEERIERLAQILPWSEQFVLNFAVPMLMLVGFVAGLALLALGAVTVFSSGSAGRAGSALSLGAAALAAVGLVLGLLADGRVVPAGFGDLGAHLLTVATLLGIAGAAMLVAVLVRSRRLYRV